MPKCSFCKKINLIFVTAVAIITSAVSLYKGNAFASNVVLSINALGKIYTFTDVETGVYKGERYLKNVNEIVNGIYLDTVSRPIDASITFTPEKSEKFQVKCGKTGLEIDKEDLVSKIKNALNGGVTTVSAKAVVIPQKVTASELNSYTYMRSRFTTYYSSSSGERKHNIALACSFISGKEIMPNEEFSFNETVGERSETRGFKQAKVILDGNYVDGVGGGVCQVSTTLYNAALLAGAKITEQHSHSLQVSYIEPSFDAMVNSGYGDLKFVNDTGGRLYLYAKADGSALVFEIYGKKISEQYERISVITDKIQPESDETIESSELLKGETVIERYSKIGIKSEGYLITYVNGERVKNVKIRSDSYKPIRGKIIVGTKEM